MKKWKKVLSVLFSASMLLGLLAGCGSEDSSAAPQGGGTGGEASAAGEQTGSFDTSKKVDLVFYLVGDQPNDMAAVQDAINDILLEKINATVTFNFTTWTDWTTKYNMVLSSGEPCDLIYTANWMDYAALSKRDAFQPLDELLPVYAPDVWELIPEEMWNQMRVNDTIYSVPTAKGEYTNGGIMYREDLRAKYDLPVPNNLENAEAYMLGIKENEPNQPIMSPSVMAGNFNLAMTSSQILYAKNGWVDANGANYGLAAAYNNPRELYYYWETEEFKEDMELMKRWADMGFWSKSVLSENNDADTFTNGQSVIVASGQNAAKYIGVKEVFKIDHPDWEVAWVPFADANGVAYANHPSGNGTAVPTSSNNAERALMALNLLYCDQELNRLVMYGFEGEHYNIDENGFYVEGPKFTDYKTEGANTWNLRNPNIGLTREADLELEEIFAHLHEIAMTTNTPDVDINSGFIEDYDEYSAERAAIATVMVQYLAPLQAGLVPDVDAAIAELLQKAEEAGIGKIHESYRVQWAAYCDEYGF